MLNTYHLESRINSLGPGLRYGIWVQTCKFACKGCLVPDSWHKNKGKLVPIHYIAEQIIKDKDLEGITISGGEPLLQTLKLTELLNSIREIRPELNVVVYTGYQIAEAAQSFGENFLKFCMYIDVIIDGLYDSKQPASDGIRGSKNQNIYLLSNRITQEDLNNWTNGLEYHIKPKYSFVSGIPF